MKHNLLLSLLLVFWTTWAQTRPQLSTIARSALPDPATNQQAPAKSARQAAATTIRYVKAGASGTGTSWSNASGDLQAMINAAASGDQVWVATGIYKPTTTTDRSVSFVLKSEIAVYGGFTGSETTLSQRLVPSLSTPSSTTLSGDINNDGTLMGNSYHVVHGTPGLTATTILDGFVIASGNGDAEYPNYYGGGLFNEYCSPIIRNCFFIANRSMLGGAVCNFGRGSTSSPQYINCGFVSNVSTSYAGAMFNAGNNNGHSSPQLINCSFISNTATLGGAIVNDGSSRGNASPQLINCSFLNNSANSGGVLWSQGAVSSIPGNSNSYLTNCVFFANGGSRTIYNDGSATVTATYSLFESSVGGYVSGPRNLTTNTSPFVSETDLRLTACAPAVNAGDNGAYTSAGGPQTDLAGNPRFYADGQIDMGAYEYQGAAGQPVAITQQPISGSLVCAGSPVSVPVPVSGTSPSLQWFKDGQAVSGQTSATLILTNVQPAQSGSYVAVVSGCNSVTSTPFSLTVNPLPTPGIVGLASAYCQDTPAVSLAPLGSPAGGSFAIDGTTDTVFNPAMLALGDRQVTYSYSDANGCTNGAAQTVTVKPTPTAPVVVTQSGGAYPAGVSSLTISQNTGNVILTVLGCPGGTITWNGGNSTRLAVETASLGTQSFTATCTSNGCTSPTATATVTVVVPTLKVLSRDPDNGQLGNNTLKPYLLLQNAGTTPIPYSSITLRYWLTTENDIPLLFQKNYIAIGQNNVQLRYVPLATPRQGATGYIEYSFSAGAGSLAPGGNSGPIETQINKQDYSQVNQLDDYSYINNSAYTLNPRITAYQNGTIFYGQEPNGSGSGREAAPEEGARLVVKVLGNPVLGQAAEIEISGVRGQVVELKLMDLQGKTVQSHSIQEAAWVERVSVPLGDAQGLLLLEVSTATQRQQIKLLRP